MPRLQIALDQSGDYESLEISAIPTESILSELLHRDSAVNKSYPRSLVRNLHDQVGWYR
jgi:hypothetical protein